MRSLILGLLSSVLLLAVPADAAIIYVDNTSGCPGNGSSATPYCSIANALTNAAAGQDIKIRTGTGVYSETVQVSGKNGTSGNPIILEPDTGANFVIRNTSSGVFTASIQIRESDYWTIRNLTFDANGVSPSMVALHAQCTTRNCTGWVIQGNTFRNWHQSFSGPTGCSGYICGPEVLLVAGCHTDFGCSANYSFTATIENNTFQSNDGNSIEAVATANTVIRNNTITGMRCGRDSDASVNALGMRISFGSQGIRIYGNQISDLSAKTGCTLPNGGYMTSAAIWADACRPGGGINQDSQITTNVIYNINQSDTGYSGINGAQGHESSGLFIESQCAGWTAANNVIYNVGNEGIIFSYHGLVSGQSPNYALNNTIYSVGQNGFFLKEGVMTVKNNIVKNAATSAVCLGCGSGSPSLVSLAVDYNLYDDGGSQTKIGTKNAVSYNLANWRTQCGCDAHSLVGDPRFVSLITPDFHLQSGSPARGSGEGGVDIGAYAYIGAAVPQAPTNAQVAVMP